MEFKSFHEYAEALDRMQKDIEVDSKLIARAMGERAQKIAEAAASADLGGDPKFSHWKPALDTQLKSIPNGVVLIPTKSSAGPWTVAQQGRHQGNAGGFSGPGIGKKTGLTKKLKSGGVGKVKATKGTRWNGVTQGKGTAGKAVAAMERQLPPIADKGIRAVMVRHFDVD